MKSIGVIRKIDSLGRVVIPKEVRDSQGWSDRQPMEMYMDGPRLVLQAHSNGVEKDEVLETLEKAKKDTDKDLKAEIDQAIKTIKTHMK